MKHRASAGLLSSALTALLILSGCSESSNQPVLGSVTLATVTTLSSEAVAPVYSEEQILSAADITSDKTYKVQLVAYGDTLPEPDNSYFGNCEFRIFDSSAGKLLDLITIDTAAATDKGLFIEPLKAGNYIREYPMVPESFEEAPYSILAFSYPSGDFVITGFFCLKQDEIIRMPVEYKGEIYSDLAINDNIWLSLEDTYTYFGNSSQIVGLPSDLPPTLVSYHFDTESCIIKAEEMYPEEASDAEQPKTIHFEGVDFTLFNNANVESVRDIDRVDLSEWTKVGIIDAATDISELPTENFQANFPCEGAELYRNKDNFLLIRFEDDYMFFKMVSNEKVYTGALTPQTEASGAQTAAASE